MASKKLTGEIVSSKMDDTVVVAVTRLFEHPRYQKRVRETKRFKAVDPIGVTDGDYVIIEEIKPVSKDKCWKVVEIIRSGGVQ